MLASGAHIKLGSVEYVLAEEEEPHYNHDFESLFAPTSAIAGEIAKEQIRPEKLLWSQTDWSGGEGAVVYYPQNPTQYDQASLMNVTKRGQLTTRTQRYRTLQVTTGNEALRPVGGSAYTHAVVTNANQIIVASDATTWTDAADTSPNLSAADFADMISDGTNLAVLIAALNGSADDTLPVIEVDASTTTWADMQTGTVPNAPVVGAVVEGLPYTFGLDTTLKLFKKAAAMDTAADWGATTVYNSNITPIGVWGTNFWTSMCATETSLFFSYATKTHSFLWESRQDVVRPVWTPPPGIVIKKLIYHLGVVFALGNTQAAGSTFAAIYAFPLSTRTPVRVASPRRHLNTSLSTFSIGCPGWESTILAADENSGKIFIYDMERDSLSLFDDLANGGTGDGTSFTANTDKLAFLAMHGARLFAATWEPVTGSTNQLQLVTWDDLEVQNRDDSQSISATLESAEWDFGLPMEIKSLNGFYVSFKVTDTGTTSGLIANSRITISYSADDATYVGTTAITSATTPTGAKGRVFIPVVTGSATVAFTRLKVKITLDNNSQAVAPPIVYSVTTEAQPLAYAETWTLAVRVEDEAQNERPTLRANIGSYLRDQLEDLAQNKTIITFLDGYRYKAPNSYTTHTVTVEDPHDDIKTLGEGVMRVRLRAVV